MTWSGVYPAVTTQFRPDESLDLELTQRQTVAQLDDGVDCIIALGTCGENSSLTPTEKQTVLRALREAVGRRAPLIAGVDDLVLEAVMLGAVGWVSGLTSAFPREAVAMFKLARAERYAEALTIYRWLITVLHLDSIPTLVQCIKLASALVGRGTEHTRAPRLPLEGAARARLTRLIDELQRTRPVLPSA